MDHFCRWVTLPVILPLEQPSHVVLGHGFAPAALHAGVFTTPNTGPTQGPHAAGNYKSRGNLPACFPRAEQPRLLPSPESSRAPRTRRWASGGSAEDALMNMQVHAATNVYL